jgi:hypothetical protein
MICQGHQPSQLLFHGSGQVSPVAALLCVTSLTAWTGRGNAATQPEKWRGLKPLDASGNSLHNGDHHVKYIPSGYLT